MKRLTLIVLISTFLVNCGSEDNEVIPDAPSIPPLRSFVMDFSIEDLSSTGRQEAKNNWTVSVLSVAFWNTVITANRIVPAAAFTNAIGRTPNFDASIPGWVWEYNFDVLGVTHTGKLIAKATSTEIQWEMLISRLGFYDEFSWFTGTSALNGLSGTWTLNRDTDNPEPFTLIEWNRALDGTEADIKYTNIASSDSNFNGFIFQKLTSDTGFDRFYDIFYPNNSSTVNIEWSSQSGNGRIKDPARFGDPDFKCWDETQEDIECPT